MFSKAKQRLIHELESSKANTKLGSGWISGVFALVLSLLGLFGVLAISYPDILTMPPVRESVDVGLVRFAIQTTLAASFILACISLILKQHKALGFSAATLSLLAVILGGSAAESNRITSNAFIGLDWLVLNLIITGTLFLPLERLFRRVDQSVFRPEWREDLFYFAFSSLMVQSLTYLTMLPSTAILENTNFESLHNAIASQPIWLQFIEVMILTDFMQYWFHRMFHQIPFLWKFHAVHHSAKSMDWLAGSRMHVLEIILLRSVTIIPVYVLGFENTAIYAYIVLVYVYATYIHANLKFDIEFLKPILVTPRFHHWHHGIEKEAINVNYSIHFPIFDRLFGTYYMPKKQWPSGYGIHGHPVPQGFLKQLAYPFKKSRKT